MILHCNFEELRALASAGELILATERRSVGGEDGAEEGAQKVEMLLPMLTGDVSIATLSEQRRMRQAVDFICRELHQRMDDKIIEFHPAHEEAVALYFDYGHSRTVLHRLDEMGAEMEALLDLMTGGRGVPGPVTFPD
jgi:hypothetical protein